MGSGGRFVLWLAAGSALLGAACKTNSITQTSTTNQTVGAMGGTVTGPNGAKLTIPPGALAADTTFSIGVATQGSYPAPPGGAAVSGGVYAFEPLDQTFQAPVTVALPLAGSGNLVVGQSSASGPWTTLSSQTAGGFVTAQTISLGYFAAEQSGFGSCSPRNTPLATNAGISVAMGSITFHGADGAGDCVGCGGGKTSALFTFSSFANLRGIAALTTDNLNAVEHVGDVVMVTVQIGDAGTSLPVTSVRAVAWDARCGGSAVDSTSCTGTISIASADSGHTAGTFTNVTCQLRGGGTGTLSGSFDVPVDGQFSYGPSPGWRFDPGNTVTCCIP